MSLYETIASLPLRIEGYALQGLSRTVSSGFERKSTIFVLQGGGEEGRGEDVTYEPEAHDAQQQAGPVLELAGEWTFDSFSEHLATLDLFPGFTPQQDVYRRYRRWGFESAALDLALRQADTSLHELLGRTAEPITFVVSSRMGDPPTIAPVTRRLAVYPNLRFKLDATPDWPEELIVALQESGAVDSIDFKGAYKGTLVDTPTDPDFYKHIAQSFPDAWLEDPDLETDEARNALAALPGPDHVGRADPLRPGHPRRARDAAHGQPQAVALRLGQVALRGLRVLRAARDGRLRRRPVRARRRPRAHPAAGRAVSPERAQRHRAGRLRRRSIPSPGCPRARSTWTRHHADSAAP